MKKVVNCTAVPIKLCSHSFPEVDSRMCFTSMQNAENTSLLVLKPDMELKATIFKDKVVIDPLPETDDYLIVSRNYATACNLMGLDTSRLLCVAYDGNGGIAIYPVVF